MKYSFTMLCLAAGALFAQSPITLSNSNMPANTDTLRYSSAQLSSVGNYTQTGTSYNWDFSALVPVSQGIREFKSPLSTPYAIFFLSFTGSAEKVADTLLNVPPLVTLTNYYLFYKKSTSNPNAYLADGAGLSISGIPLPSYYSDKDEIYNFPMTYPKYDSTSFRFSTPSTTATPFVYSSTGTRATRVDGWGTITTPFGTAPCLRLVSNVYAKDSIKTSLISIPFTNNTRSYQWLTNAQVNGKNVRIPMLEVSGTVFNGTFTPTQVRYRDNYLNLNAVGIRELDNAAHTVFYPNPVGDQLHYLNTGQLEGVNYTITDVNGKTMDAGVIRIINTEVSGAIPVKQLSPGVYTIRLAKQGTTDAFRFIKN